jgi:hypothetical protein
MHFEARGEGREGMLTVGWTVLNRVQSREFPAHYCQDEGAPQAGHPLPLAGPAVLARQHLVAVALVVSAASAAAEPLRSRSFSAAMARTTP